MYAHIALYPDLDPSEAEAWKSQFSQLHVDLGAITANAPVNCAFRNGYYDDIDVNNLNSINNNLVSSADHELFEIELNEIYLSTIIKGNFTMTQSQLNTIENIANECPLTKGNAVFVARGLYNMVHNTNELFTNACNAVQPKIINPTGKQHNLNFEVFPNPASNEVLITLSKSDANSPRIIELRDVAGKLVRTISVPPDVHSEIISVSDLHNGIYFISGTIDENKVVTERLIINR